MTKKEKFIYDRCVELLQEGKISNMSIDDIAAYVSVSKVTIYKYFKSKELLLEKVFLFFLRNIMLENEKYYGIDKLKFLFEMEVKKSSVGIELMQTIFLNSSEEFKKELSILQHQSMEVLENTYNESKQQGYFKGFALNDFVEIYSTYVRGVIAKQDNFDYTKSIQLFFRLILNDDEKV